MSVRGSSRPGARAALTALALGGALLNAGCGGSSSPGVAHVATPTGSGSTSSTTASASPASPASQEQAMLAFAKCMRANGEPSFPDPSAGGGFIVHGVNPSSPVFKAAQAKCQRLMPGGGLPGPGSTTSPSSQTLARFLRVAQCMRAHGIRDFPDPRTSVPSHPFGSTGAGVISDIEGVVLVFPSTIDESSPQFTQAAAACAFPLHDH